MPSFDGLTNTLACVHARCIAPKPLRAEFLEASTSVIMVARSVAPLLYGVPVSGALRSECVASRAAPIAQNVVMLGNKKEGERVSQRPRERGSCECTLKLAHNVLLQKVALIHNERLLPRIRVLQRLMSRVTQSLMLSPFFTVGVCHTHLGVFILVLHLEPDEIFDSDV